MTQISITSQPVSATVSGDTISASVPAASGSVGTATVTGGVGPQGPAGPSGPQGAPGDALSSASDVVLSSVAEGDVLRYSSSKWRNYSETNLVDGGNW